MELTLEMLRNEHSDLYNTIFNAGVISERSRMQNLDELDDNSIPEIRNIVAKARYETGAVANDVAIDVIKAQRAYASKMKPLNALTADASQLDTLSNTPVADEGEEKEAEVVNGLKKAATMQAEKREKQRGGKK